MRKNISLKSIGVTVERPVAQAAKVVAEDKGKPMQIVLNDRLGKRVKIDCFSRDTVGQLKQLAAAKLGTRAEKIRLQKWKTIYKDHIRIEDYDISDGMSLEMYND
jgi:ubiquitin-like protein 5